MYVSFSNEITKGSELCHLNCKKKKVKNARQAPGAFSKLNYLALDMASDFLIRRKAVLFVDNLFV